MTASVLVLWQLAAAVLVPVIVLATTEAAPLRTDSGAGACPVCEHQATSGAACPMHAEPASRGTEDGACALTSSNTTAATVFTLLGSGGLLTTALDMSAPVQVAQVVSLRANLPLDFSPVPSFPPPRA